MFIEGGTYVPAGTDEASVNITYNYSKFYGMFWTHNLYGLDGLRIDKASELLVQAIEELGTEKDTNYWKATAGNAGAALQTLLNVIQACPRDSVVEVI